MDLIEFYNLLSISGANKRLQFKVVQLQIDHRGKKVDRIYFGDAEKFVHAKLLEEALAIEKIPNYGTERLISQREVCAREGTDYKCLGMGLCSIKVITSKRRTLWLLKFFGGSEYHLIINVNHIENRVRQCIEKHSQIEIERQNGGGFYNYLPSENRINVKIWQTKSFASKDSNVLNWSTNQ